MKRFGEVIKARRLERGWSLKLAAGELGTFKGYICGIETGKLNPPSAKMIRKISKVYGLDLQDLLARSVYEKLPKALEVSSLHSLLGDVLAGKSA